MDFAECKRMLEENREHYRRKWLDNSVVAPGKRRTKKDILISSLFEGYFNGYDEALLLLDGVNSSDEVKQMRQPPKVAAIPRKDGVPGWQVFCGFCDKNHLHGGGLGHRVAHCISSTSPYDRIGYILVDAQHLQGNNSLSLNPNSGGVLLRR